MMLGATRRRFETTWTGTVPYNFGAGDPGRLDLIVTNNYAPPWFTVKAGPGGEAAIGLQPDFGADVVAYLRGDDGAWSPPEWVNLHGDEHDIALGTAGRAVVAATGPDGLRVSARQRVGEWTSAPPIVSAFPAEGPTIAADATGNVSVAWHATLGGRKVVMAAHTGGNGWSAPVAVSLPGAGRPHLVLDGSGVASVAWIRGGRVEVARRDALAWEAAVPVSPSGQRAQSPDIAAGGDGTVAVAWTRTAARGTAPTAMAAVRRPDGTWSTPHALGPATDAADVAVAVATSGNVAVAWGNGPLRAAVYDTGAPETATAG